MIPPPNAGPNMFQGTIRRFLIATNQTTTYPIRTHSLEVILTIPRIEPLDSMGSCLWSLDSNCYKVNPNKFFYFTCPEKTYKDFVSYTCAACPVGCDICANGSLYGCTTCSSGFVSVDGACQCDTGTYYDSSLGVCSKFELLLNIC